MSQDDQEALAAQWAAQLEEEEAGQPGGDAGAPEVEAGDAGAAAGDQERSPVDDETLAAQWAEALAEAVRPLSAARAREAAARPRTPTSRI